MEERAGEDEQDTETFDLEAAKRSLRRWLDEDQFRSIIIDCIFKGNLDRSSLSPRIAADPCGFLLSYYAYDLLAERVIRESLVASLINREGRQGLLHLLLNLRYEGPMDEELEMNDAAAIKRWEKGGPMATAFSEFFDLPRAFAGKREERFELIAKEAIQARMDLPDLHDYQELLVQRLKVWMYSTKGEDKSAILVLPTGTGKTMVAGQIILDFFRTRSEEQHGQIRDVVLWLAHTRELCEQAHETIEKIWTCRGPPGTYLNLYRFWGNIDVGELQGVNGCVIAGVQKLYDTICDEDKAKILDNFLSRRLRLIVIDEAHLADNPSYMRTLEYLSKGPVSNPGRRWKLLGLSATPFSSDEERSVNLKGLFTRKFKVDRSMNELEGIDRMGVFEWMQEHRYLSHNITYRPVSMPSTKQFRLKEKELEYVRRFSDLNDTALARLTLDEDRNDMIVDAVAKAIKEGSRKILLFACSVAHCHILRATLAEKGIKVYAVTGGMPRQERSRVISNFKNEIRKPIVLINYAILTTGFDDPKIDTVFITRPTWSRVLYHQMIGRGLRGEENGGNPGGRCLILDVKDNFTEFHGIRGVIDYLEEMDRWSSETV